MKMTSYLVAAGAALALIGCGSDKTDSDSAVDQRPEGDLASCLAERGFVASEDFVATVIIDGAEQESVVRVPGREDQYAVIYRAPSPADATRLASDYAGGPFADAVGDRIYTFTGGEPTAAQQTAFERCLAE